MYAMHSPSISAHDIKDAVSREVEESGFFQTSWVGGFPSFSLLLLHDAEKPDLLLRGVRAPQGEVLPQAGGEQEGLLGHPAEGGPVFPQAAFVEG